MLPERGAGEGTGNSRATVQFVQVVVMWGIAGRDWIGVEELM